MAFAQLTYRESLRDIQVCLRATQSRLYHLGIPGKVSHNTLAHANQTRDWRIYADFAQVLIEKARKLYAVDSFGIELDQTVYALDSTTIDLCLALFPWAEFRKRKGAVKLHTILDLHGNIPSVIIITTGKCTMSISSTSCSSSWGPFTSWIAAISILPASTRSTGHRHSLSLGQKETSADHASTLSPSTNPPASNAIRLSSSRITMQKKTTRKNSDASATSILQILSLTLFEKEPIYQALSNVSYTNQEDKLSNQLNLFN
jgi:hypothetical protein